MASAPSEPRVVTGRVDRACRLLSADPALLSLQEQTGAGLGDVLALPQVAAVARLSMKLKIPVERTVITASDDQDFELWVRAIPAGEETVLELDGWESRPATPPRLGSLNLGTSSPVEAADARNEWQTDGDLRLISLSPTLAALIRVDAAQVKGMPLTKLVQLLEDEAGEMPMLAALAGRQGFSRQPARTRGDSPADLLLSAEVVMSPDGRFDGFRGSASVKEGSRGEAPSSGHEGRIDAPIDDLLRSPLDRIIADAEHIIERTDGPLRSDYASYGNDIAAAARHLAQVLGAMGTDPEYGHGRIDLGSLAAEAMMLVEPAAEERQVRIELVEAAALPANGEEHAVIQILVNLIGNAVRHSPAGTVVKLRFATADDHVSVSVIDQGQGIAPADQQRIFEPFERADEQPGGTGLGLAISRRLARSMGGDVRLESNPGEGACFTLTLPSE